MNIRGIAVRTSRICAPLLTVLLAIPSATCAVESRDSQPVEPPGHWLRGDLHLHSHHSTDALDNLMEAIVPKAEGLGFDYFVVTDHDNHVNGELTTWNDPDYHSDSMIMLYGVEWTTGKGHANFFAAAPWNHAPLWAVRDGEGDEVVAAVREQGLHLSVNHPVGKDLWEFGFDMEMDSIEVWNALYLVPNMNDQAIELWDGLLATGRRITGRGGSDCHHQEGAESRLFNMGNPTTWVFAADRSANAVLEALAAGRVTISYAPSAERIDFRADPGGHGSFQTMVGDNLADAAGGPLGFRIEIVGFREGATYEVAVLKNGAELTSFELDTPIVTFEDTPAAGERSYYRVEVRGATPDAPSASAFGFGGFVAMTNPIYVGFD